LAAHASEGDGSPNLLTLKTKGGKRKKTKKSDRGYTDMVLYGRQRRRGHGLRGWGQMRKKTVRIEWKKAKLRLNRPNQRKTKERDGGKEEEKKGWCVKSRCGVS